MSTTSPLIVRHIARNIAGVAHRARPTSIFATLAFTSLVACNASAQSQGTTAMSLAMNMPEAQQESDYRVIAARCGSPAFEKAFFKQSKAYVAAGRIRGRDAADVEKAINSLRRNPLVLVNAQADCVEQMARLNAVMAQRKGLGPKARGKPQQ